MREQFTRAGEGFLLVYSINNRSSFEEISTLQQQILRVKDRDNFPIVIVANMCELENERQVSREEGQELAERWDCVFFETSTKDCIAVEEIFYSLVREIRDDSDSTITTDKSSRGSLIARKAGFKRKCLIM